MRREPKQTVDMHLHWAADGNMEQGGVRLTKEQHFQQAFPVPLWF